MTEAEYWFEEELGLQGLVEEGKVYPEDIKAACDKIKDLNLRVQELTALNKRQEANINKLQRGLIKSDPKPKTDTTSKPKKVPAKKKAKKDRIKGGA